MKAPYVYREEEPDPLVDTVLIDITAEDLIKQLKLSRKLVVVAEWDRKIFEKDRLNQILEEEKERAQLLERKRQAELSIRYGQDNLNHVQHWLEKIWVRFARSRTEALPFRCVSMSQIRIALQRRINTKRRKTDSLQHSQRVSVQTKTYRNEWRSQLEHTLSERRKIGINIFRSGDISTADFYLRTIVRQTRELTMSVGNQMTYFDALKDAGNKFTRIKGYLEEDHIHFGRTLDDLKQSIVEQEKQLGYLAGVFNESNEGAYRAEKAYNETDLDLIKAAIEEKAMLKDLHGALEDHRSLCTARLKELVDMNVEIKNCFTRQPIVRTFPFHRSARFARTRAPENTELVRTYEQLEDLTQTSTPAEVLTNVKQQVEQCAYLQSANRRLDYLLETILHPEDKMFSDEYDYSSMSTITRREGLDKSLKKIHDEFDKKITAARWTIAQQRDTTEEFEFFVETLGSINERLNNTFPAARRVDDPCVEPGLLGLLTLTETNLIGVASVELAACIGQSWDQLRDHVHHRDFLEYRSTKLPASNDRTKFDQPSLRETKEEMRLANAPLAVNTRYLTNAQILEANWQIKERARLAELERLKLANQKDEEERQMLERRKQREDAAASFLNNQKKLLTRVKGGKPFVGKKVPQTKSKK